MSLDRGATRGLPRQRVGYHPGRLQVCRQRSHARREPAQLLEMDPAQLPELVAAERRESLPHEPMVVGVDVPINQPGLHRAIHEPHCAVVTQQQRLGEIADRRRIATGMTADGEQHLMLGRRDADVPTWRIPGVETLHRVDLTRAVGAGVVGAAIAVGFTYLTLGLRRLFRVVPGRTRPIVGGHGLTLLALWSPYALTFGEVETGHVLTTRIGASVLIVAAIAKLIGTSLTVSSGWPGGFIIPPFFVGATVGRLTHHAFAAAPLGVVCAALMVSVNVGVTKTMIGSKLIVTEMGGLRLLPTTLIAAAVCFVLTNEVGLIHSQRERSPRTQT